LSTSASSGETANLSLLTPPNDAMLTCYYMLEKHINGTIFLLSHFKQRIKKLFYQRKIVDEEKLAQKTF